MIDIPAEIVELALTDGFSLMAKMTPRGCLADSQRS
jgi:hypothetical protein